MYVTVRLSFTWVAIVVSISLFLRFVALQFLLMLARSSLSFFRLSWIRKFSFLERKRKKRKEKEKKTK